MTGNYAGNPIRHISRQDNVIALAFLFFFSLDCAAQKPSADYRAVERCMEDYVQLSRLGPGYSRDMSQEITGQFFNLFERGAFLYWDLYLLPSDSLPTPLHVQEYVELAKKVYRLKQPVLDYADMKILIEEDSKRATVILKKLNHIMDPGDHPAYTNNTRLNISISLAGDKPLIRNISEEKKRQLFSSISAGLNLIAWSNVVASITHHPEIMLAPNEQFSSVNITAEPSLQAGGMAEIRIQGDRRHGLRFSTGVFYSHIPLASSMKDYTMSAPDTVDQMSANPLACTAFVRSSEVHEWIVLRKIEIPFLIKTSLNKWLYVKAGTALGYVWGSSKISYQLSRTGGGTVTNLTTSEQYYLDPDHEFDQAGEGYYRNKNYDFTKNNFVNGVSVSIQLAAGIEKQVSYFNFACEPNVSFGTNMLVQRSPPGNYHLENIPDFHPVLETIKTPAFEFTIGFRLIISYLFKV
jgi:hypothetical protein